MLEKMKVQGNLIIFSTDNEERKDVRRLKEKNFKLDKNGRVGGIEDFVKL